MATTLNMIFRSNDGDGRKVIKIPEPPADINTKTAVIQDYMTQYAEGRIVDYPLFDEAVVESINQTTLVDLIAE